MNLLERPDCLKCEMNQINYMCTVHTKSYPHESVIHKHCCTPPPTLKLKWFHSYLIKPENFSKPCHRVSRNGLRNYLMFCGFNNKCSIKQIICQAENLVIFIWHSLLKCKSASYQKNLFNHDMQKNIRIRTNSIY